MTSTLHRIAAATLISAGAHAVVVIGLSLSPPVAETALPPLEARLVGAPPAPAAAEPSGASEPRRGPAPRRSAEPVVVASAGAPAIASAVTPTAEPAPVVEAPPPAPERTEPTVVATAPASTLAPEAALRMLPRRGRIVFALTYGDERSSVGRVTQTWEAEPGRYALTSEAQTTGLIEMFRPQRWRYASRGELTAEGLRPESFTMNRNRNGRQESSQALFDWTAGNLRFGNPQATRDARLPPGTQDLVSLAFQFAVAPPAAGRFELPVTNGSRFETYTFEALPEERISTPLGALRAIPVKQVRRDGEEGLEIWLATEYRHLPVRIRYVARDGTTTGEQVAAEISVSDQ